MNENQKSGLVVASLVLGIIGVALSLIPIINNVSFVLGIIGLVLGVVGLIKKNKKGLGIAGIILCVLAIGITIASQQAYAKAFNTAADKATNSLNDMSGDNTEDILGKKVSVDLGQFTMEEGQYGLTKSSLPVTVKNLSDEAKTFNIQIEAVDASGNRIDSGYVSAGELGAGQSQDFEAFTFISDDKKEAMKTATFKVVQVQMF
jgi:hypothetical protein